MGYAQGLSPTLDGIGLTWPTAAAARAARETVLGLIGRHVTVTVYAPEYADLANPPEVPGSYSGPCGLRFSVARVVKRGRVPELVEFLTECALDGVEVHRLELALDDLTGADPGELVEQVRVHARFDGAPITWHRHQYCVSRKGLDGTLYMRGPEAQTNLAVYGSRPSKLAPRGSAAALHAELRYRGAAIPQDLATCADLVRLVIDPEQVRAAFEARVRLAARSIQSEVISSSRPRRITTAERLFDRISVTGFLEAKSSEIAAEWGVGPDAVQKAARDLIAEGLIEREVRQGAATRYWLAPTRPTLMVSLHLEHERENDQQNEPAVVQEETQEVVQDQARELAPSPRGSLYRYREDDPRRILTRHLSTRGVSRWRAERARIDRGER